MAKDNDLPEVKKLRDIVDKIYNSEENRDMRKKWSRHMKEFTGHWWKESDLKPDDSRVFVNWLFSTIQQIAPLITDQRPEWNIIARFPFMQRIADIYSNALQYLWDSLEMDQKLIEAVYSSLLTSRGIFKVYFDPDADEIAVDVVDPNELVIPPGYTDEWKMPWLCHRRRMPLGETKKMFPDMAKDIKPDEYESSEDSGIHDRHDIEMNEKFVTVYELWMRDSSIEEYEEQDDEGNPVKKERQKYPNGRIVWFTKGGVKLSDKPSPFAHGRPPYVSIANYLVPFKYWGISEGDQIENLNREFNARLQQIVEHLRNYTNVVYLVSKELKVSEYKIKKAIAEGDHALLVNLDANMGQKLQDMIHQLPYPNVPPGIEQLIAIIPTYIEELTGVTDITKGQVGKRERQSASEVSVLIESSHTRVRQRVRNLEIGIKRLLILIVELMQQYYSEPRNFFNKRDNRIEYGMVTNDRDIMLDEMRPPDELYNAKENGIELSPEDQQFLDDYHSLVENFMGETNIYIDFDVQIETNSTLPMDKSSLANLAIQLYEMGAIDEQAILETLRFPGKDRIMQRLEAEKQQQLQLKGGQAPPQGGGAPMPQAVPQDMSDQMVQAQGGMM